MATTFKKDSKKNSILSSPKGQIAYISPHRTFFLAALNGNIKIQNLIHLNAIL